MTGERPDPADGSTPGDYPVRSAESTDRPALFSLQAELPRPSPQLLTAALSGVGTVLVSPADGRPVGYLLAVPGSDDVYVAELVVASAHRREGRASALVESLSNRFEKPLRLAVGPDNRSARRCYESLGFVVADRDPDFFDGDPALWMVRE